MMFIKSMKSNTSILLLCALLVGCQKSPFPNSASPAARTATQPAYTYLKPMETPLPKRIPASVKVATKVESKVTESVVNEEQKESVLKADAVTKLLAKLDLLDTSKALELSKEPSSISDASIRSKSSSATLDMKKESSSLFPFSRSKPEENSPVFGRESNYQLELSPEPMDSVWLSPAKLNIGEKFPYSSSTLLEPTKSFLFSL